MISARRCERIGRRFRSPPATRQQRLAGAGRAVEQDPWADRPQPLEQFRMPQWQLDHFAQLVDRVGHPAEIVIGDVRAALAVPAFGEFGQQLDLGILVDMDDAARRGQATLSLTSCRAKAGALISCLICSGMSALTRWWPAVATVSPSQNGRPSKLRLSACADPEPDVILRGGKSDLGRRLAGRFSPRRNRRNRCRHWHAAGRRGG